MSERMAAGDFTKEKFGSAERSAIFRASEAPTAPLRDCKEQPTASSLSRLPLDRHKHESSGYLGELDASD